MTNRHNENVVEIRSGENYIRTSSLARRYAAIVFLVDQLDLTEAEVRAARTVLDMDNHEDDDADE